MIETTLMPYDRPFGLRVGLHLVFWGGVFGFLILFFGHQSKNYEYAVRFVALLMPVVMTASYVMKYYVLPLWLRHGRFWRFVFYAAFTLIVAVYFEMMAMMFAFIAFADQQFRQMNPLTADLVLLMAALTLVVVVASVPTLVRFWFASEQARAVERERLLELQASGKQSELDALRAQIHPHFLFNTLNNLYSLALRGSDRLPELLLHLSSLLDRLLHHASKPQVPLGDELALIDDYVALEAIRFTDPPQLQVHLGSQKLGEAKVAPLLLLPLVENAYKHGFNRDKSRTHVLQITVDSVGSTLSINVWNSLPEDGRSVATDPRSGLGLRNLKRRIELNYGARGSLDVQATAARFEAKLELPYEI